MCAVHCIHMSIVHTVHDGHVDTDSASKFPRGFLDDLPCQEVNLVSLVTQRVSAFSLRLNLFVEVSFKGQATSQPIFFEHI